MNRYTAALWDMFTIHLAALVLTVIGKLVFTRYYVPGISDIYAMA